MGNERTNEWVCCPSSFVRICLLFPSFLHSFLKRDDDAIIVLNGIKSPLATTTIGFYFNGWMYVRASVQYYYYANKVGLLSTLAVNSLAGWCCFCCWRRLWDEPVEREREKEMLTRAPEIKFPAAAASEEQQFETNRNYHHHHQKAFFVPMALSLHRLSIELAISLHHISWVASGNHLRSSQRELGAKASLEAREKGAKRLCPRDVRISCWKWEWPYFLSGEKKPEQATEK